MSEPIQDAHFDQMTPPAPAPQAPTTQKENQKPMGCDPGQCTLIGGPENMKLLFDNMLRASFNDRDEHLADRRAWEDLKLRRSHNGVAFDHLVNMMAASASQVGSTEGQSQVTPIRSAAADTEVQMPPGAAYPPNRAVDAGVAESVQTNVTTQVSALSEQITALGGTITTALQALSDSNVAIANALAQLTPSPAPAKS